jgi:hypothetical protein
MKDLIKVMLIAKKARLKVMENYILNTTLQLECQFLRAEITALETELSDCIANPINLKGDMKQNTLDIQFIKTLLLKKPDTSRQAKQK